MKSLQFLTVTLIAATLALGGAGCKKTPKPVTIIPKTGPNAPGANDANTGPFRAGNQTPGGGRLPGDGTTGGSTLPGAGNQNTTTTPIDPNQGVGQGENRAGDLENADRDRTALQAETVYFDFDRAEVKSTERSKVEAVATYLRNNASAKVEVEGNCDERGTEEYNRSLGERRALAVREYLVTLGIDASRVSTVSFGEDRPAVIGSDESAYSKNRRADFVVLRPSGTGIQ